jgi:membrane-bound metal-dependent hydrolase YbcI (DUF457 family)
MPFTPLHLGPGIAFKAVAGRYFSLTVFGCAQVLMDIEPLVRMMRGDAIIHGFSHTYLGALLLASIALSAGKPLSEYLLRAWNQANRAGILRHCAVEAKISWLCAGTGAFIGTLSHVLLDSLMHVDMSPFAPFALGNAMLYFISVNSLHLSCLASGTVGGLILLAVFIWRRSGFK